MKPLTPRAFVRGLLAIAGKRFAPPPSVADNPVLRTLYARRSIRRFRKDPIPPHVMTAILEAGRLAPCAVNLQSWCFGVFDRKAWQEVFGRGIPFGGVAAVLVCGDVHRARAAIPEFPRKPLVDYTVAVVNASIAAYAMNVAAEGLGVGSVLLSDDGRTGFYHAAYLRERLGLPDGVYPLMTLVLGYPAAAAAGAPPKLPLAEITFTRAYRESEPAAMRGWLEGMAAGYRAMHVVKSFRGQLRHYVRRVDEAEGDLRRMIFHAPQGPRGTA